jgi:hypothetical protein
VPADAAGGVPRRCAMPVAVRATNKPNAIVEIGRAFERMGTILAPKL